MMIKAAAWAFGGVVFIVLCIWAKEKYLPALALGAIICFVLAIIYLILVFKEEQRQDIFTITSFAEVLNHSDPEVREMLAGKFPKVIQYTLRHGVVEKTFEDTGVPVTVWQTFLKDSNDRYISPLRNWYTAAMPERHWWALKNYLEAAGYVLPDSAAGNHSYLWTGSSYKKFCAYWLMVDRSIQDMSDWGGEEVSDEPPPLRRQYAYGTPLPHRKDKSEEA